MLDNTIIKRRGLHSKKALQISKTMRILFTPYSGGSIAHIVRSLAVADELKKRGHDILFTTIRSKKKFINDAGYEVFGDGHEEVNLNDQDDQSINYFYKNRDKFLDWLQDEIVTTEKFNPDIIVNSPSFFGPLSGLKTGKPYVSIINAQWLTPFKGLLGVGMSQDHLTHRMCRKIGKPIFSHSFERMYMDEIQGYYKALDIGYMPKKRIDLHKHYPIIIPSIPEFEPLNPRHPKDPHKDIHYVGPLFWQGFEKPFHPSMYFKDLSKPLIYISLGGSIYRKQSYDQLIHSLIDKKEWNSILSLGPNFERSEFPEDTTNFKIVSYVPGLGICEYADAIINTAGHGTVMQALWHGKPLVTIPHNIDQGTIASRLEELGLGVNLNKINLKDFFKREQYYTKATQVPFSTIITATKKVLNNPHTHSNTHKYKEIFRSYDNASEQSADIIESYARKTQV